MTIVEMLLGGGGAVALFRWLTARDRLATAATADVIASLNQQLEAKTREGEERIKALADVSEKRIEAANARALAADLESARFRAERDAERLRREQAEAERDGLRSMVEGLRVSINEAVEQFRELEAENRDLRKELASRADNEARERAAGTVENTGPHPAVKLPTT